MRFRNSEDALIKIQEFIYKNSISKRHSRGKVVFTLNRSNFVKVEEIIEAYNKLCRDKDYLFKKKVRNVNNVFKKKVTYSRYDFDITEANKKETSNIEPKVDCTVTTSCFNLFFGNKKYNKDRVFKKDNDIFAEVERNIYKIITKNTGSENIPSEVLKNYLFRIKAIQDLFDTNYRFISINANKNIDKALTNLLHKALNRYTKISGNNYNKNIIFAYNQRKKNIITSILKNILKSSSSTEIISSINSLFKDRFLVGIEFNKKLNETSKVQKLLNKSYKSFEFSKKYEKKGDVLGFFVTVKEDNLASIRKSKAFCELRIIKGKVEFSALVNRKIYILNPKVVQDIAKKFRVKYPTPNILRGVFNSKVIDSFEETMIRNTRGSKNDFLEILFLNTYKDEEEFLVYRVA